MRPHPFGRKAVGNGDVKPPYFLAAVIIGHRNVIGFGCLDIGKCKGGSRFTLQDDPLPIPGIAIIQSFPYIMDFTLVARSRDRQGHGIPGKHIVRCLLYSHDQVIVLLFA